MSEASEAIATIKNMTAEQKAAFDAVLDTMPRWTPQSGPQQMAYESQADILFYGGAAGGGKTDLLLGLALTSQRHSIIFRREAVQLIGIEERMTAITGTRLGYNSQTGVWRLPQGRVMELEDQIGRAEVIDISKLSGSSIKFGATVTLVDEDTDEKSKYQIVGDVESDARKGRISLSSPIARALIGKSKGDSVEVAAPGGARSYEILKVEFV